MNAILDWLKGGADPATAPVIPHDPQAPIDHFDACVAVTLGYEGGFVDNPKDPGGATNFGITLRTIAHYLGRDVTVDEVRNMDVATARAIYRANYWNALRCAEMPAGVALSVFDFAVNSGPARAAKDIQVAVQVASDGEIGEVTIAAIQAHDQATMVKAVAAARMKFLHELPTFPTFGDGWTKRVDGVLSDALGMVA